MALNDDILDALTRHEIGIQRLSNATVRKMLRLLSDLDDQLVAALLKEDISEYTKARQKALLVELRRIVDSAYTDASGQMMIDLAGLADYEADFQSDMFKATVPVNFEYVRPSADQLLAAVNSRPFQGRILSEWFADLNAGAFKRLRASIRMGFIEGRTTDQMVRDIRGTRALKYTDGILQINRRAATTAVRTAVSHTANTARSYVYERNKDLIKGVQWTSTLDGRTSAICRARDGKVYDVDKGPRPPAHPNCRSSTVPVLKSWRELGYNVKDLPKSTRASMNGQAAEDLTYGDWLAKQPAGFQDDVLGDTKGKLFRKGGLTVDRFVDRAGNELTLDQLKKRESEAWEKAGLTI